MENKINLLKLIISAIVITIVAQIIHSIGAGFGMKYYMDPQYCFVWSKIMMPEAGPPPASFMIYSLILGLISSILFVLVYVIIHLAVSGKTPVSKGLVYGILVFLVGGLPGRLSLILLVNLPTGLIIMWTIEGLIINLINGMIVAKMNG